MFSFLHLLYTGDFKADGWVLITVETEDLYFYLDATAKLERINFLGLKENLFPVASSVNGQNREKEEEPQGVMVSGTRWCLTQPGDIFTHTKTCYLLAAGGCSYELCSSLHRNRIPIICCNCHRILLGFHLINCQGKVKKFNQVSNFQSHWIS